MPLWLRWVGVIVGCALCAGAISLLIMWLLGA